MIVVGVDGSRGSRRALAWAAREAALRGTALRAVYAWRRPVAGGRTYIPAELLSTPRLQERALALLDAVVEAVADGHVPVEPVAVEGQAADVLVGQARDAELLVVGSRGHGRLVGALVGSVGQGCLDHAPCPVVVVPPPPEAANP
jgi:nucleotide-binding universal stress UspA family protein